MPDKTGRTWLSIRRGVEYGETNRSTLLALGLKKEVEIVEFAGRLYVSAESIDEYRKRRGVTEGWGGGA